MTTPDTPVTTEVFTTTSGQYLAALMGIWLPRYWWSAILPPLACAALGAVFNDWRFYLVALMLVFIVIPMGMSFLYTYYLLTPEARRAILPKRVTIEPGECITLTYEPVKDRWRYDDEKGDSDDGDKDNNPPVPEPERMDWKMVKGVKFASTYCLYILDTPRLQFIMVPYSAMPQGVSRQALCL